MGRRGEEWLHSFFQGKPPAPLRSRGARWSSVQPNANRWHECGRLPASTAVCATMLGCTEIVNYKPAGSPQNTGTALCMNRCVGALLHFGGAMA